MCWRCQGTPKEIKKVERHEEIDTSSEFCEIQLINDEAVYESKESSGSMCVVSQLGSSDEVLNLGCHKEGGLHWRTDFVLGLLRDLSAEPKSNIIRRGEEKTRILQKKTEEVYPFSPEFGVRHIIPLEALGTPQASFSSGAARHPRTFTTRSSTQTGNLTHVSDWGNLYDEWNESPVLRMSLSGSGSGPASLSDRLTERETRLSIVYPTKKIKIPPRKVMGMFHTKKDYRFQILSLNSTLDEIVDLFLFKESGTRLPVSFSKTEVNQPRIMSVRRMGTTLTKNLGPQFDARKQGLFFTAGCVNSELCYKMKLVELSIIENLFSFEYSENLPEK